MSEILLNCSIVFNLYILDSFVSQLFLVQDSSHCELFLLAKEHHPLHFYELYKITKPLYAAQWLKGICLFYFEFHSI